LKTFSELTLIPALEKAVAGMSFTTPTPIQAQSIPVALSGRDLIASAQTGSGKTLAFGIPILNSLSKTKDSTALILVPTRELATQITDVFRQLTQHMPTMRVVSLIGGMSMQPQLRALQKGFRIIVATPGRLLDHLDRRSANLSKVSILTLDEADRMLDMGFAPQLREIFKQLPNQYQTLLFSATLPPNIIELTKNILENPAQVKIGEVSTAAPLIDQKMKEVRGEAKNDAVLNELNARKGSILIFARTQARTDRLCRYLEKYGVSVTRIHGGRSQGQRNRALDEFRSETVRVLVATDIAARGIDIDHVAHVINYDLPQVAEDYVHRIGRTGRAGRTGEAMTLMAPEERPLWREIQKLLAKKSGGTLTEKPAQFAVAKTGATSSRTFQHTRKPETVKPKGNFGIRSDSRPRFGNNQAACKIPQPFFKNP
jgi:ATP-dependent RNA helicase RhlE